MIPFGEDTARGPTTIADAGRLGAAVVREAGRLRGRAALSRGGARVAKLDANAASHRAYVHAIRRVIPLRFDPRAAVGLKATFELRLRDPRGRDPDRFELKISDGRCRVSPGASKLPGAIATIGAGDLIMLVSGAVGWPALLSSGRLELSGDPFLALRFPILFRLPATATQRR